MFQPDVSRRLAACRRFLPALLLLSGCAADPVLTRTEPGSLAATDPGPSDTISPSPQTTPASSDCLVDRTSASQTQSFRYVYDAAALTLSREWLDTSSDGAHLLLKTFDASGAIVRREERASASSTQALWSQQFTNDAHGNPSQVVYVYGGGAGETTAYVNTYDSQDHLESTTIGAWRSELDYANGALVQRDVDVDSDGVVEARYTATIDSQGTLTRVTRDGSIHSTADGSLLAYWTFAYDGAGRLAQAERFGGGYWDAPASATPQVRRTWSYAADGSVTLVQLGDESGDAPSLTDAPITTTFTAACTAVIAHEPGLLDQPNLDGSW